MKNWQKNMLSGVALGALMWLSACRPAYEVVRVEGTMIPVDTTWDAAPDAAAVALLAPYTLRVDSIMNDVIGEAAVSMDRERPESPLTNLVADVLRESATSVLGRPADMGLVNVGGIRNSLTQGPVTVANAFELLPFENSLCVLTVKGSVLKRLLEQIAARGGEGVSGIRMVIDEANKLKEVSVAGKPLDEEADYTVATVDYLAEGNDGMSALIQADKRVCPEGLTLRSLFIEYVKRQTAAGKKIAAQVEGRVIHLGEVQE